MANTLSLSMPFSVDDELILEFRPRLLAHVASVVGAFEMDMGNTPTAVEVQESLSRIRDAMVRSSKHVRRSRR